MEYPFGGHHHNRRNEDEEEFRPPPPPPYGRTEDGYPAERTEQRFHSRPPTESYYSGGDVYDNRPPTQIRHQSHVVEESPYGGGSGGYGEEGRRGHGHHHGHGGGASHYSRYESYEGGGSGGVPYLEKKRTVRIYTKAGEGYSLAARDGQVVLVRADRSDETQHWIKNERYSTKVKDQEGFPSFALVNSATGEAIKHSIGATQPVLLVPYDPNYLDESILWTESSDTGDDFRCIRMVNNIDLNFDAFHGDKDHGGVRDGTIIVLWEWLKGENQRWKIVPY